MKAIFGRELKNSELSYVVVAIFVVTALVLFAMGRIPTCECGYVKLWHGVVNSSENSQHLTDPYTFSHLLHGFAFFVFLWYFARNWSLGVRGMAAIAIEAVWEIIENTPLIINRYRSATISLDYMGDSIVNSLGDILVVGVAFWFASRVPVWVSVVTFLAIEIGLALWIRDGLTLNLIMFIHPFDSIRAWQLGS